MIEFLLRSKKMPRHLRRHADALPRVGDWITLDDEEELHEVVQVMWTPLNVASNKMVPEVLTSDEPVAAV